MRRCPASATSAAQGRPVSDEHEGAAESRGAVDGALDALGGDQAPGHDADGSARGERERALPRALDGVVVERHRLDDRVEGPERAQASGEAFRDGAQRDVGASRDEAASER